MIRLVEDTIDERDIGKLIQWLKTCPRLTKGPKTVEFEKAWAKYLGTKESVFVNSGSSANLIGFHAMKLLKFQNIGAVEISGGNKISSRGMQIFIEI